MYLAIVKELEYKNFHLIRVCRTFIQNIGYEVIDYLDSTYSLHISLPLEYHVF